MHSTDKPVNLPPVRLVPGRDDDLLEWRYAAMENNINLSATVRQALREYWQRREGVRSFEDKILARLDRIETALKSGSPIEVTKETGFNDPILDGGL